MTQRIDPHTILSLADARDELLVGGKAANLQRLLAFGARVPRGIVITAPQVAGIQDGIIPDSLWAAIRAAWVSLRAPEVIVRSSAVGEDSKDASFAGQLDSILDVRNEDQLRNAILRCRASASSDRVLVYERSRGHRLAGLAIIVQEQIASSIAGVLFTVDPGAGEGALIEYCAGAGEALVSGRVNPGRLSVSAAGEVHHSAPADGVVLDEAAARDLAAQGSRLAERLGSPQDIEWTIDGDGRCWLVQARPITATAARLDAEPLVVWSNANVNENFPEPISPLLYSVAAEGYYHYFRNLGRAFGLPRQTLAAIEDPLRHIIGVHAGRMYYNLTNIHTALQAAPFGDELTASFNQFVGTNERPPPRRPRDPRPVDQGIPRDPRPVDQGIPRAPRPADQCVPRAPRPVDQCIPRDPRPVDQCIPRDPRPVEPRAQRLALARIGASVAWQYASLPRRVEQFERRVDAFAASSHPSILLRLGPRALLERLRGFMEIRCHHWKNASLADAAAMVCYAGLKAFLQRHFPSEDQEALHNTLLKALPDLVSAKPALELWTLSRLIRSNPRLSELFASGTPESILETVRSEREYEAFRRKLDDYLENWGFRCSAELMLTVPSFQEDPRALVPLLRAYAQSGAESPETQLARQRDERLRETRRVLRASSPAKALVLRVLLLWTQRSIQLRERARLKQALLYSRLRRIALAIGSELAGDSFIDRPDEVFMLTVEEIDGLLSGASMFPALVRDLTRLRRTTHEAFREVRPPDTLRLSYGAYFSGTEHDDSTGTSDGLALTGTSACGGRATARATVLADVTEAHRLAAGDILVTRQTDPGWGPVFPLISGLVMERGGMLSHGAIIAREFGIPSVVGVNGATQLIPPGALVCLDGDRGTVRLMPEVA